MSDHAGQTSAPEETDADPASADAPPIPPPILLPLPPRPSDEDAAGGGLAGEGDVAAELRLIRQELAGLRQDLRAATDALTSAVAAQPAPGGRLPVGAVWLATVGLAPADVRRRLAGAHARAVSWRQGREWAPPHHLLWDLAALVVVVAVAWWLRGVNLATIPPGLHGDEAATGLEGRRVLADGWIGVYTGMAGGNPTGVYYLAALALTLIDDPIVAVRTLSAVGGVLGIAALYVLVRRNLGFGSAVVAAVVLTFSEWHIQFSRTGFVTGLWPTVVVVGAIALMEAIRTASWRWWAAAGALLSAGIYVYNGHAPFLLVLGLFVGWRLLGWRAVAAVACLAVATRVPWPAGLALAAVAVGLLAANPLLRERARLVNTAAFAAGSLIVLRGMILFARNRPRDYFGRSEALSVFRSEEWAAAPGLLDRADLLLDRYRLFWDRLTFLPVPDGVDLSGSTPLVPELTLWLCLGGLVVALVRRPHPLVVLSALVVALAPLSAVLTDMTMRRALVIAPFLAVVAGVGAVEALRLAARDGRRAAATVALALVGLIGWSCYQNYVDFFDETVHAGPVQHTFAVELRETAGYLDGLPDDAYVYLYSERWWTGYDILRLLAPDLRGEDPLPKWGGSGGFAVDRSHGRPVIVLMGVYTAELPALQAMYPGGEVVTGTALPPPLDGPAFVAYVLPP